MRSALLLVHGIGDQKPDWALDILKRFERRVLAHCRALVKRHCHGHEAPRSLDAIMAVKAAHWADVLQERQARLREVLEAHEPVQHLGPWWWRLLIAVLGPLWRRLRRWQARFVSEFIGDIIGYREPGTYGAIHAVISAACNELADAAGGPGAPLTIVAHSIGSVIASDHVWDAAHARRKLGKSGFHERFRLENFFTIGSPLAQFSLRYGGPDSFASPIRMESPRGRWVNIYDPDDPIGMPLKALNEAHSEAVLQDAEVESGVYLVAHNGYFAQSRAMDIVAAKVALDWLARQDWLAPEKLRALYSVYDRTLGIDLKSTQEEK